MVTNGINVKGDVCLGEPLASYCVNSATNAKALFVFAHGAGANKNHVFMEQFTQLLLKQDISVLRFNFPFMDKRAIDGKRYPPDRMPKLIDCYTNVLSELSTTLPLFIGGKSMGGRVAATVACGLIEQLKGVICIGYPFHPAKKTENLRLAPLLENRYPVLITQGERDTLGCKTEIAAYQLPDSTHCVYLPDGDHDLKPRVKSGYSHTENLSQAVIEISKFIDENRHNN